MPVDALVGFIPKKLSLLVFSEGIINKQAWECALLTSIRDEIKVGNLTVNGSKCFGNFDNFFMPYDQWEKERSHFFQRSILPDNPKEARDLQEQRNTCSCLTLILAIIIYWQAKEIKRIIDAHGDELDESCLAMIAHIRPIGWENVILYGEYVLDRSLVR